MSQKNATWLVVLGTLAGILFVLGMRFKIHGRLSSVDLVAVLAVVTSVLLAVWPTFRYMSRRQAAGVTFSSRKQKILIVLLVIGSLWGLLSISSFFRHDLAARDRRQAAEDIRKTVRFVRFKAGQRDATGWVAARSTDGQFAVMMPDLFNELRAKVVRHGQEEQFSSLIARSDEAKFTATVIPYEEPDKELAERRKDFLAEMEQTRGGQVTILEEGLYAETYPRFLVEGHVKANDSNGLGQVVLTEKRGYILTVEADELTDALHTAAMRFFQSLEILTPDPNAVVNPNGDEAH